MSYLVLARKYRPQIFDEVVGQKHVIQTLQNSITKNKFAHAILFSGPRGTGKTSIARIIAKSINCLEQEKDANPCNKCLSCLQITDGSSIDIFEIDGASNNSVDQVRTLIDNIKYNPVNLKYKIYIIDEVHMLSNSAFNALLKTLEEPPSHVFFIFATTEIEKIPVTILSRCQKHMLNRIKTSEIFDSIKEICKLENIKIEDEASQLICKEADGSMRDALSLLDQASNINSNIIKYQDILQLFGLVNYQILFELSDATIDEDVTKVIDIIETMHKSGKNIYKIYLNTIKHFKNLLLVKLGHQTSFLSSFEKDEAQKQSQKTTKLFLLQALNILMKEEFMIKYSSDYSFAFQFVFIKILENKAKFSLDTLIEKIDDLCATANSSNNNNDIKEKDQEQKLETSEKTNENINLPNPTQKDSINQKNWKNFINALSESKVQANISLGVNLSKAQFSSQGKTIILKVAKDLTFLYKNLSSKTETIKNYAQKFFKTDNIDIVIETSKEASQNKEIRKENPIVNFAIQTLGAKNITEGIIMNNEKK